MIIRVRIVDNAHISNKPKLDDTYTLVFIKSNHLTKYLGNKSTSKYYIYKNGELFGNLKRNPNLKDTEIKNQIKELDFGKIVKVGLFKIIKIILWGKGNLTFSLHGEPLLYDKLLYDDETHKWQKELDLKIKKNNWAPAINSEKQYLKSENKEKLKIKKEGWIKKPTAAACSPSVFTFLAHEAKKDEIEDNKEHNNFDTECLLSNQNECNSWNCLKPLTKNNHPPDMDYPPVIWKDIPLEISKNNKTGYKYISCFNTYYSEPDFYFKKDKYEYSDRYKSPVIAAYHYALWKREMKEIKKKEQKMLELYPNKRYIYCPFEEKDECKFNGGQWDNNNKMWYIPRGIDNEPFKNWFYPYKNNKNYIEKQILYWFYYRYCNIDLEDSWFEDSAARKKEQSYFGIGKWLIWIDISSTNYDKLKYLNKKVGITGFKIHQSGLEQFSKKEACICIYCGWSHPHHCRNVEEQSKSFEEQKEWIKYIGFNISKDFYLKSISNRNKIFFKTNIDTYKHKYSFNSKSSKFDFNFI